MVPAGRQIHSIVNEQNFRDFYNPETRKWGVLVPLDPNAETTDNPAEAGPGGGDPEESGTGETGPPRSAGGGAASGDGEPDENGPGGDGGGGDGNGGEGEEAGDGDAAGPGGKAGQGGDGGEGRDRASRNLGGHAGVGAWDSHLRSNYSRGNLERAIRQTAEVEDAIARNRPIEAMEIADEASDARNAARRATPRRLSPGGRVVSQLIEGNRSRAATSRYYSRPSSRTPSRLSTWLRGKLTPGLPEYSPRNRFWSNVARNITIGSGSTNQAMSVMSKVGKPLGVIGVGVGVGVGIYNYVTADPEDEGRVAAGEIGAFVGGAALGTLGTMAGAALLGLLVSNPAGWLVIGVGLIADGIAAWFGSDWGRSLGEWIAGY